MGGTTVENILPFLITIHMVCLFRKQMGSGMVGESVSGLLETNMRASGSTITWVAKGCLSLPQEVSILVALLMASSKGTARPRMVRTTGSHTYAPWVFYIKIEAATGHCNVTIKATFTKAAGTAMAPSNAVMEKSTLGHGLGIPAPGTVEWR